MMLASTPKHRRDGDYEANQDEGEQTQKKRHDEKLKRKEDENIETTMVL
jgi:hypothetical protein